ncbi:MAG: glycosyltransferase family 39 protein [Defluviitaleaceae bacterium]|nr:glycosyltransferase family 39 protein [Defluviitaleaceae bacterium]
MELFGLIFTIATSVIFWAVAGITAVRVFRNADPPIEVCRANSNHPPKRGDCDTNIAERFNWCRNTTNSKVSTFDWKDILKIITFGLGVRLLTLLVASFVLREYSDASVTVFQAFLRGDAPHYINLARTGYSWEENGRNILLVFFPLYGYLVRGVNFIFRDYIFSAYFVSFICYLAGLVFVFHLVSLDFSKKVAWWAVVLISISPPAFFFGVPMTESLMLLTSAATLYYIRTHKWFCAGVVGALAVFTRMVGVVLFAAAIAEIIQSGAWEKERKKIPWILLMTTGGAAYLLINWQISGEPFRFMYYQRTHWFNTTQYFGVTVYNQFVNIASFGNQDVVNASFIPNILAFLFAISLLAYACVKRLNAVYIVYTLGYTFISFSPAWLLSGARYMVACVPLFIFLAHAADENPTFSGVAIAVSLMGMFALMRVFILGGPVF